MIRLLNLPFALGATKMVALLQVNQPKIPTARLVIPSGVEGFRSVTVRLLRGFLDYASLRSE